MIRVEMIEGLAQATRMLPNSVGQIYQVLGRANVVKRPGSGTKQVPVSASDLVAMTVALASRTQGQCLAPTKQLLALVPDKAAAGATIMMPVITGTNAPAAPPLPLYVELLDRATFGAVLVALVDALASDDAPMVATLEAAPPSVHIVTDPDFSAEIVVPLPDGGEFRRRYVSTRRRRRALPTEFRFQSTISFALLQYLAQGWRESRAAMAAREASASSSSGGNPAPGKRGAAAPGRAAARSSGVPETDTVPETEPERPYHSCGGRPLPPQKGRIYPIEASAIVQGFQTAPPKRSLFDDPLVSE